MVESSPSVNPTISWSCEIRTSSRFPWIRCIRVINFTPETNQFSLKAIYFARGIVPQPRTAEEQQKQILASTAAIATFNLS